MLFPYSTPTHYEKSQDQEACLQCHENLSSEHGQILNNLEDKRQNSVHRRPHCTAIDTQ